jgi:hypothetical protein
VYTQGQQKSLPWDDSFSASGDGRPLAPRRRIGRGVANSGAPKNYFRKRFQTDLACPASGAKIYQFTKIRTYGSWAYPALVKRGVAHRHERGAREAVDAGLGLLTNDLAADGEIVWS